MPTFQSLAVAKSGGVSVCVEIPTNANPYEYAKDSPGEALGDGSNPVAWYLAAGYDRVGTRLFGMPKHASKTQVLGKCSRVHHGRYTFAVTVPKRGASVTAVCRIICKELCSVPFDAFKNQAQLRGHPVPSRDDYIAADRAVADSVSACKIVLSGKFRNAEDEKKFKGYAEKGHKAAEGARERKGKAPAVPITKNGLGALSGAVIPAKGLVAFSVCEYLETINIPARVLGDHVHVPKHTAAKILGIASSADKKAAYKNALEGSGSADAKKAAMLSYVHAASIAAFAPAMTPPTPAVLANDVFAAMKKLV